MLVTGMIKPIQHPRWLSYIMPVKNKNGQIRCCVEFRNLNRACPKDEFPLPNMDLLIDSAAGNSMFSFIDGLIQSDSNDAKGCGENYLQNTHRQFLPYYDAFWVEKCKHDLPTYHDDHIP